MRQSVMSRLPSVSSIAQVSCRELVVVVTVARSVRVPKADPEVLGMGIVVDASTSRLKVDPGSFLDLGAKA